MRSESGRWRSVLGQVRPKPDANQNVLAKPVRSCCSAFGYYSNEAGRRGFGIFTYYFEENDPVFILQHRALDPGGQQPPVAPTPLSLVSEMQIQFCPWCGIKLNEFYKSAVKELERNDLKID